MLDSIAELVDLDSSQKDKKKNGREGPIKCGGRKKVALIKLSVPFYSYFPRLYTVTNCIVLGKN